MTCPSLPLEKSPWYTLERMYNLQGNSGYGERKTMQNLLMKSRVNKRNILTIGLRFSNEF